MMGNYRKLVPCLMDEKRRSPGLKDMDLEFIVAGNGKVSAVKVNGQRQGPFSGCVLNRMQSFNFPKYNGSRDHRVLVDVAALSGRCRCADPRFDRRVPRSIAWGAARLCRARTIAGGSRPFEGPELNRR